MYKFARLLADFRHDEQGATAVEYGLIAALITVGIIAALQAIGTGIAANLTTIGTALTSASSGSDN